MNRARVTIQSGYCGWYYTKNVSKLGTRIRGNCIIPVGLSKRWSWEYWNDDDHDDQRNTREQAKSGSVRQKLDNHRGAKNELTRHKARRSQWVSEWVEEQPTNQWSNGWTNERTADKMENSLRIQVLPQLIHPLKCWARDRFRASHQNDTTKTDEATKFSSHRMTYIQNMASWRQMFTIWFMKEDSYELYWVL